MNIHILYVGRREARHLQDAIDEYAKRLVPFAPVSWQELVPQLSPDGSTNSTRERESEMLAARIKPDDWVVVLDERGSQLDNAGLAELLEQRQVHGTRRLVFIIGGAHGVSDGLRKRADFVWSLSKLVFPHELVRLLVIEQLYRSSTILANKPYHH